MPRLRFFGSRRFLPKFARRLPPASASARLFKARCTETSGLDGSGETRGRQALWITTDDVYQEFGRRSALRVHRGLPMPGSARRRAQARRSETSLRAAPQPARIPEKPLAGVIVGGLQQRPACPGDEGATAPTFAHA